MSTYVYSLTKPLSQKLDEFREQLLNETGKRLMEELPKVNWLCITLGDPDLGSPFYPAATVRIDGQDLPVDAVIELACAPTYPFMNGVNELLEGCSSSSQGWRTKQLAAYGDISPIEIGQRCPWVRYSIFVQRADGMSSEDFAEQWGVRHGRNHGEETLAPWNQDANLMLYEEHLLVEPMTPTAWLVHGYEPVVRDSDSWQRFMAAVATRDLTHRRSGLSPADIYNSRMPVRAMAGYDYFLVANADRSRAHRRAR